MKRIDPDALYGFILNRWGQAVAAQVCPEVAEPERPEPVCVGPGPDNYGDGWGFDIIHEPLPGPTKPAEAVIDKPESDCPYCLDGGGLVLCRYNEGDGCSVNCPYCGGDGTETRRCREPRSNACGGSSEQSSASRSSPTPSSVGSQSEPALKGGPAHAADPGLTDEELSKVWFKAKEDNRAMRGALGACVRHIERERERWVQDNSPDADEGTIDEDAAPHLAEIDAVLDSARAALAGKVVGP